jgi:PAS domain-containing protein
VPLFPLLQPYRATQRAIDEGNRYEPIIFEEDRKQVTQLLNSINQDNPVVTVENRVVVQREVRWTQWVNRGLFDEQGRLVELQSVGRDISDRKLAELELRLANERLQHLLTASPAGIYSCKPSGNYDSTFLSDNVAVIVGYEPWEFQESSFWANHIHPDDKERIFTEL